MADLKNRQWILAKPPVGMIKESDYRWKRRRETGESLASFREQSEPNSSINYSIWLPKA
jgi:hypothetical protein